MKTATCDRCGARIGDGHTAEYRDPGVSGLTWMPIEVLLSYRHGGESLCYDLCGQCHYSLHHQFLKRIA